MKKIVSGLIIAVFVTPVLAEKNYFVEQGLAPLTHTTSSYNLEIKEGENTLSTFNFAAIDNVKTTVKNLNVETHASITSDAIESNKVITGFEMTLNPVENSQNFMNISFDYHQPNSQNKQEHVYTFETGVVLAKGGSFCTGLSGIEEKVKFCLSRI